MKIYIPIDDQIKLLESRNIIIKNKKFAARMLEYENYYYVINGYKQPFVTSTNPDVYRPGTTFNAIVALYSFDRRIREIISPHLFRIEHVIKSQIINVFSKYHGHNHTSYLRPESFNSTTFENFRRVNKLIFDLCKEIDYRQKDHAAIKHYMNNHGYVPLWVLSKIMTFGKVTSFYGVMLPAEKNEVANLFGLNAKKFKTLIDYLAVFRNKCSHGERIYCAALDAEKPRPIPVMPAHAQLGIPQNKKGYKYGTYDVLALLIAMKPFIQEDRFSKLIKKIDYALNKKLAKRLHPNAFSYVTNTSGLVGNWADLAHL